MASASVALSPTCRVFNRVFNWLCLADRPVVSQSFLRRHQIRINISVTDAQSMTIHHPKIIGAFIIGKLKNDYSKSACLQYT